MKSACLPLVSVVIPLYNHEKYIGQCLSSVLKQTYPNIEIILIDDGSKDSGLDVARGVLRGSSRSITIIEQENRGAHNAINRGIDLVKGDYITILNSDDYFGLGRVWNLVNVLDGVENEMAFSRVTFVDENSVDISGVDPYGSHLLRMQEQSLDYVSLGFALLEFNIAISTGNLFFTRRLKDVIGKFRDFKCCHDWDFILRSVIYTEPFFINESSYFYRLHSTNSFKDLHDEGSNEGPEVLRNYFSFVKGGATRNERAPSPRNWPFYFEAFIKSKGYEQYL